jgi:hypothetical protein
VAVAASVHKVRGPGIVRALFFKVNEAYGPVTLTSLAAALATIDERFPQASPGVRKVTPEESELPLRRENDADPRFRPLRAGLLAWESARSTFLYNGAVCYPVLHSRRVVWLPDVKRPASDRPLEILQSRTSALANVPTARCLSSRSSLCPMIDTAREYAGWSAQLVSHPFMGTFRGT